MLAPIRPLQTTPPRIPAGGATPPNPYAAAPVAYQPAPVAYQSATVVSPTVLIGPLGMRTCALLTL